MRILFFSLAFVALAQQERDADLTPTDNTNPASINGTVLDATTRLPISGAQVILHYATSAAVLQGVSSELNGTFHFSIDQPGQYAVEAGKDGYLAASQKLAVDKQSTTGITLALASSIGIKGSVRDAETKKALPGFTVSALRVTYSQGRRSTLPERVVFTDDKGDFRFEQLPPGEYFLEIKKFPPGAILSGLGGPDTHPRYPQTVWPGDALSAEAVPLTASSGETDIGYVNLAKTKPGRIRGEVMGLDCAEDSGYNVSIQQRFGSRVIEEREASLPCGSAFTVPDLSPGEYRVRAQVNSRPLRLAISDVRIESGSDLDLSLRIRDFPHIIGSVTFDCKDCDRKTKILSVTLRPVQRLQSSDPELFGTVARMDEQGGFQGLMPLSGPVRLSLEPLPERLFIKCVIYNGAEVGATFQPNAAESIATVQVVLSDQPSELTGMVQVDGQPVANAHVVIAPWPLIANDGWSAARMAQTNSDGRFSFAGLPAGNYRAVRLKPTDWERRDMPGILTGLLIAGEDITLDVAESKSVVVK